MLGLDGVSALVIDPYDSQSGGEIRAAVEPSSAIQVGSTLASSEPLIAVSTSGYLSASLGTARGNGRPKNYLPPLPPLTPQTQSVGGGVKLATVPRVTGASVISRTEPPRGIDPALHHRDAAANLAAAAKLLSSSGSQLPKVLNPPIMKNSSNIVQPHATGSSGPDAAHSHGSSKTRLHLCTPEFLAAAADKNFSCLLRILQMQTLRLFPILRLAAGLGNPNFGLGHTSSRWRPPTPAKQRCPSGNQTARLVFPLKNRRHSHVHCEDHQSQIRHV